MLSVTFHTLVSIFVNCTLSFGDNFKTSYLLSKSIKFSSLKQACGQPFCWCGWGQEQMMRGQFFVSSNDYKNVFETLKLGITGKCDCRNS